MVEAIFRFQDADPKHHKRVTILAFVPTYTPNPREGCTESEIMVVYADKSGAIYTDGLMYTDGTPAFKLVRPRNI